MKYTQPTFTEPVSTGKITDEQYEIAVGVRCPRCRKKLAGITGWCGCPTPADLPIGACQHGKPLHYQYPCAQCMTATPEKT